MALMMARREGGLCKRRPNSTATLSQAKARGTLELILWRTVLVRDEVLLARSGAIPVAEVAVAGRALPEAGQDFPEAGTSVPGQSPPWRTCRHENECGIPRDFSRFFL